MSLDAERSIETGRTWQDLPPEPPEGDPLSPVSPATPEPPPQQAKASYWPWALGILVFLIALAGLFAWSPWNAAADETAAESVLTPNPTEQQSPQSVPSAPSVPPGGSTSPQGDGSLPDGGLEDLLGGTDLEDLLQGSGLEDLLQGSRLEDLLQGSGLEDLLGDLNLDDLLGSLDPEDLLGPGENGTGENGGADPFSGLPLPNREPVTALFFMGDLPDGITEVGQSLTASSGTTRQVITVAGAEGRITIRGTAGEAIDTDVASLPGEDVDIDGWDGKLDISSLRIVVTWVEDSVMLELIAPVSFGSETVIEIAESVEVTDG